MFLVHKKVSGLVPPPELVHACFIGGIFLICLLKLRLELVKVWFILAFIQSKDVYPLAISSIHVYTTSNYSRCTQRDSTLDTNQMANA